MIAVICDILIPSKVPCLNELFLNNSYGNWEWRLSFNRGISINSVYSPNLVKAAN